jgi:ornithine cyclodeaminase/alanine dehydrogenase-like protein (mu-crystallin family)
MDFKPSHWSPQGFEPAEMRQLREKDTDISSKMVTLGSVVAGSLKREPGWITVFGGGGTGGSGGLGVQFAAVANLVYQRAREEGLGFEIDGKWFRQPYTP